MGSLVRGSLRTFAYMRNGQAMKQTREAEIAERYGEILDLGKIARTLGYPSRAAVLQARRRGTLPFELSRLPNRRGWFTTAKTVANVLLTLERAHYREDDMT